MTFEFTTPGLQVQGSDLATVEPHSVKDNSIKRRLQQGCRQDLYEKIKRTEQGQEGTAWQLLPDTSGLHISVMFSSAVLWWGLPRGNRWVFVMW